MQVYAKNVEAIDMLFKCYRHLMQRITIIQLWLTFILLAPSCIIERAKKSYKIWTQSQKYLSVMMVMLIFTCNGIAELICRSDRHGIFSTTTMERAASKRLLSTMTKYGNGETSTFIKMNVIPLICDKLSSTNNIFINLTQKKLYLQYTKRTSL